MPLKCWGLWSAIGMIKAKLKYFLSDLGVGCILLCFSVFSIWVWCACMVSSSWSSRYLLRPRSSLFLLNRHPLDLPWSLPILPYWGLSLPSCFCAHPLPGYLVSDDGFSVLFISRFRGPCLLSFISLPKQMRNHLWVRTHALFIMFDSPISQLMGVPWRRYSVKIHLPCGLNPT